MTTLTDYLNPDDYPALQTLPFAVFITGKHHAANEALQSYLWKTFVRTEQHEYHRSNGETIIWHYSEYEQELNRINVPFMMIVQSLELIRVAFHVFGERMTLIRVDKVGDGYELVIYNTNAIHAAMVTNYEVRG